MSIRLLKTQVHTAQEQSTDGQILIRAYKYADTERGFGDAGTVTYLYIQPDKDLIPDNFDDKFFQKLSTEKILEIENLYHQDFFIDNGIEVSSHQELDNEIDSLFRQIEAIKLRISKLVVLQ